MHANVSGPIVHVFLNGKHIDRWSGSYSNHGFIYEQLLDIELGKIYHLSIITVNAGYANYHAPYERYVNGISGPVKLVPQNSIHNMVLTKWELRSGLGGVLRKMHLGSGRWDQSVIIDRQDYI